MGFAKPIDDRERELRRSAMDTAAAAYDYFITVMDELFERRKVNNLGQSRPWRSSDVVLPRPEEMVLVAYRYRTQKAPWNFAIARLERSLSPPAWWANFGGDYIHEIKGTYWQELVGPEPSEPGTETPGVVTEKGGVATEPPGVGTEAGGVE